MPELPEVETIRRQLDEVLKGRVLSEIEVFKSGSFEGEVDKLVNLKIKGVDRKSKVLIINLDKSDLSIIVHLKMTGQLVFVDGNKRVVGGHPTADWVKDLPSRHTRVVWKFDDGSRLFFNDMRRFGWMKMVNREKLEKMISNMPMDVVDREFTNEYLSHVLRKTARAVKLVILDQDKMGGMGNIYANDALFLAGIMPTRKASELNESEVNKLHQAMVEVINRGIKYGGASAADEKYVTASGLGGKYQDHFLVYERDGWGCLVCGGKINKIRVGGRGTFYCPKCQI